MVLIACLFVVIGIVFARCTASDVPNPVTGQTYQIQLKQSHWYLDYWHYLTYQLLTIPALMIILGAAVYSAVKKFLAWRAS